MGDMPLLDALVAEIRSEFPAFKIVKKADSNFSKLLDILLRLISFGQLDGFMVDFTTTIGSTIYVPPKWDKLGELSRVIVLRHERVHLRQAKKYTRILFSFLYLFVFFPVVFAYFRAKFEKEAYEETIRATIELRGAAVVQEPAFKENIIKHFTSAEYLFAWPFRRGLEAWFDAVVARETAKALDKTALSN